jgi:ribonuclease P protein component
MHTFSKAERLKSAALIAKLFKEGHSFSAWPLRVVWLPLDQEAATPLLFPVQAGFVAPKRAFKSAVQRNRVKRLMREAYRLHKSALYQSVSEANRPVAVLLICTAKEMPVYADVVNGVQKMIVKMAQRLHS